TTKQDRRNGERAVVLRRERVVALDDVVIAIANLGAIAAVLTEFAQHGALDLRIVQIAVDEVYREIQLHRQQHLLLHIGRRRIGVRFYEHIAAGLRRTRRSRRHGQRKRLRLLAGNAQRRNRERAGVFGQQAHRPQHAGSGFAVDDVHRRGTLRAGHVEIAGERAEIRLPRLRVPFHLDIERDRLAELHLAAVQPCAHARRLSDSTHPQCSKCTQCGKFMDAWIHSPPSSGTCPPLRRISYSSRNLRRNRPPGSSGTRASHCSTAWSFSSCALSPSRAPSRTGLGSPFFWLGLAAPCCCNWRFMSWRNLSPASRSACCFWACSWADGCCALSSPDDLSCPSLPESFCCPFCESCFCAPDWFCEPCCPLWSC